MERHKPKLIYLYSNLAQTGFDHVRCRNLLNTLEKEYEVTRTCAIFPDEVLDQGVLKWLKDQHQIIPESALTDLEVEVVFIEGRLESPFQSEETKKHSLKHKIRSSVIKNFFDQGGIVIFDLFNLSFDNKLTLKTEYG